MQNCPATTIMMKGPPLGANSFWDLAVDESIFSIVTPTFGTSSGRGGGDVFVPLLDPSRNKPCSSRFFVKIPTCL